MRLLVSVAGKPVMSSTKSTRGLRLMTVFGGVFIGVWGVLHFFNPSLGDFGEQLRER